MTDDELASSTLERWRLHPSTMVRDEFGVTPEAWQEESLEAFPVNERLALVACKGPGKTAVLAWLILNFLATRPHPRIAATSITGDNLSAGLWAELAKWMQRSKYLSATYTWTSTRVFSKKYPATWWAQARTWPKKANAEEQSHALAGLHEDFAMFVLDESSEIPQAVMATAEAVLGSGVECHVVQAGNPTRLDGPLYRAASTDKALWKLVRITGDPDDPKRSTRVRLEWAQQQIATYGRDNPWVKVNVLGQFPPSSINALLGVEDVERAQARKLKADAYVWAQKRLGVDVARFGDDRSVLFMRQGPMSWPPFSVRNVRTTDLAARVANAIIKHGIELTFVDDTGHWGHGVIDNLIAGGLPGVITLVYSDPALDKRYKNRRAEMWFKMADWVKGSGKLPNNPDLVGELITPTYTFVGGQVMLEPKELVKERLGRSPDLADALAETFAIDDMPADFMAKHRPMPHAQTDYDPYANQPDRGAEPGHAATDFDPFT